MTLGDQRTSILTADGAELSDCLSLDASWMADTDLELLLLGVVDIPSPFDALSESQQQQQQQEYLPPPPAIEYQEEDSAFQPQQSTGWGGGDDDHPLHCSTESDATRVLSGDHLNYQQLLSSKVAAGVGTPWTPAKRLRKIKAATVREPVQVREIRSAVGTRAARSQAGGKGKAKYVCTRERRRSEIRTLREHAMELEERVRRLQETTTWSRGGENRTATVVGMPPPHAVDGRLLVLLPRKSLWRHIAERQKERLRQSVEENSTLRNTVAAQTKLARSLHRTLKKRVAQVVTIRNAVKSDPEWSQLGRSPDDEAVFTMLLASADAVYAEIDRVVQTLERKVPSARSGAFRDWEVKQTAGGGDGSKFLSLEMASSEQVPFVRSDVHRAVRSILGANNPHMHSYGTENFRISSNALLGKTHASFASELRSGTHRFRFASKYVVEETRSIFMTTTYIDSVNADGESIDGLVLKEQKWTILTSQDIERDPRQDGRKTETTATTLIQTLSIITPEFVHPSLSSLWRRDIVESAVIPAWDSAFSATQQRLENILIDQAMA